MASFVTRSFVLVLLAALSGCRPPAAAPIAFVTQPHAVTVRRADSVGKSPSQNEPNADIAPTGSRVPRQNEPNADIAPIGFGLEHVQGYVRATMEIDGTAENPEPFVHDALFLLKGEGRLSIAVRKPWPGHPHGRVSIRCEGAGEDSTVDYEPELWFGRPDTSIAIDVPIADGGTPAREGEDLVLVRMVATRSETKPIRLTLKAAFAAEPIKPRVKAGVRPPR